MTDLLRTNPFVRIDNEFNLVNLVTNERFDLANLKLVPFFDYTSTWRPASDARERLCDLLDVSTDEASELLDDLTDADLLVRPKSTYDTLFEQAREWRNANCREELDYYVTVADSMDGYSPSSGEEWVKRAWEGEEMPDNYKTYDDAEVIQLREPDAFETIELGGDALFRPSSTVPNDGDLTERQLSELLYLSFGEIDQHSVPGITAFVKRTSPSGGARHPTEAYVAVRDADDLDRGVYHYSVKEHALELIPDVEVSRLAEHVPPVAGDDYKLLVLCGSRIERNMMKYKFPRCYTVVNQDVGHLLQTFRLLSERMGHSCFPVFDVDPSIHEAFQFSYYEEPILGGAIVS